MSMFLCAKCDGFRDSDDGCEEAPSPPYARFGLICADCMDNEVDDIDPRIPDRPFSKEQQALIDKWEAEADDEG